MHGRYRARCWFARLVVVVLALGGFAGPWSGTAAAGGTLAPRSNWGSPNSAAALAVPAGGAWAWGDGRSGQLGIGQGEQQCPISIDDEMAPCSAVPIGMSGFGRGVVDVAAGSAHSLILKEDGTVWATGSNTSGQLGFYATDRCGREGHKLPCALVAAPVPGLGGVVAVAAGQEFSLALKGDGTVWAWGNDRDGQLGVDQYSTRCETGSGYPSSCRVEPARVGGLADVIAIAGGNNFALALTRDGGVWAWGDNGSGQLGNGKVFTDAGGVMSSFTPTRVGALGTATTAIAAGQGFALAVRNDGTLWAWGSNDSGQLGNGTVSSDRQIVYCGCVATPAPVGGLTGVVAAAGGANHGLARTADGAVWGWGDNGYGELGIGTASNTGCRCLPTPQRATGFTGASSIAAGSQFSLATKADGSAWGWGLNQNTQLGVGATGTCQPATYERPCNRLPTAIAGLAGATLVSAGTQFGLAVAAPAPTFADVPTNYWAFAAIEQFATRGITTGCGADDAGRRLFCPDRNVTRAEMAVFVDRALGYGTPPTPTKQTFADVPPGYWAYAFIEQFATLGITTGCGTNAAGERLFCPDRNVTRAEMAVFIDRAKGFANPAAPASPTFADVPPGYWAYAYIEQFFTLGVTTGCGTDDAGRKTFCPDRNVTRAEMAVFIIRAYP